MVFYVCLVCKHMWKTILVKDFCFYNKISALLQSCHRSRDRIPLLSDGYTFYSVSQEKFLDELEDEAKVARANYPKTSAN